MNHSRLRRSSPGECFPPSSNGGTAWMCYFAHQICAPDSLFQKAHYFTPIISARALSSPQLHVRCAMAVLWTVCVCCGGPNNTQINGSWTIWPKSTTISPNKTPGQQTEKMCVLLAGFAGEHPIISRVLCVGKVHAENDECDEWWKCLVPFWGACGRVAISALKEVSSWTSRFETFCGWHSRWP